VLPRFTVTAAAVSLAYVLGTLIAWAQVHWMFGPLPARSVLYGMFFGVVWMVTGMSVIAGTAALLRRPVAIFGTGLMTLMLMPAAGLWQPLSRWEPTELAGAQVDLLRGRTVGDYGPSLLIAVLMSVALLWFAVWRIGRREM
jgi:hypothetical protein